MNKKTILMSTCMSALLLAGCGGQWFVPPKENPVIEDDIGAKGQEVIGTISTTSERRNIIVKLEGDRIGQFCAEPPPDTADNLASSLAALLAASASRGGTLTTGDIRGAQSSRERSATAATTAATSVTPDPNIASPDNETQSDNTQRSTNVQDNVTSDTSLSQQSQLSADARLEYERTLATTVQQLAERSQGVVMWRDGMYVMCQAYLNDAITSDQFYAAMMKLMDKSSTLVDTELRYKDTLITTPPIPERQTAWQYLSSEERTKLEAIRAQIETEKAKGDLELERLRLEVESLKREREIEAAKKTVEEGR